MNNRLFALCAKDGSIDVYDTEMFQLETKIQFEELVIHGEAAMASCAINNCLYVSDGRNNAIHRIDLFPRKWLKWKAKSPRGVSVSSAGTVITISGCPSKINEYTPSGSLVHVITLPFYVDRPRHAVKLSNGNFVFCHSVFRKPDQISLIDIDGNVLVSSCGWCPTGGKLREMKYLAVDRI